MNTAVEVAKAHILGIAIDAVNMEQALAKIAQDLESRRKGYVCLCGVHGIMEAYRNPEVARAFAGASLVAPDGMPTVWVGRHQGNSEMVRVTGPDLMLEVLRREEFRGYRHFLCGGKDRVASELKDQLLSKYPWVQIVGTHTPPFGPMSSAEEAEFLATIRRLQPDIVWVGISTPKQERFMEHYLPLLDTTLMFGVGAAFDFHTGRIVDCAEWIKLAGLQWFHRLLQDPKHLWKRYLRNNPAFIWHIALQLAGLRPYPPTPRLDPKVPAPAAFVEPRSATPQSPDFVS